MIGAILGDIIGMRYEWAPITDKNAIIFIPNHSEYTDDSVMTIAVADSILNNLDPATTLKKWGRLYRTVGYGPSFAKWLTGESNEPYNSWGNGSAMRTSSIGFIFNSLEEVLTNAEKYAAITHNHPEGIKGAQATSVAIFMARTGSSKDEIKNYIETKFGYNLSRKLDDIRPIYPKSPRFDVSCQGSVPESIISFLESENYLDAILNSISLGGDADTMSCISGGIAEAFYGYKNIDTDLIEISRKILTLDLLKIVDQFYSFIF